MCVILHIETATEVCSVSLAKNGNIIAVKEIVEGRSHASTLSVFIDEIIKNSKIKDRKPDAIAVSMGPGSYTGLRIGVSAAKGLCYGYNIPLISVSTLEAMSIGFQGKIKPKDKVDSQNLLFSPMIDARRMEVYMALFTDKNEYFKETSAQIVKSDTFDQLLLEHKIYFFGSGANKLSEIIVNKNAIFVDDFVHSSVYMASIAHEKFIQKDFVDVAYFEPFYLKDFITTTSKKNYFPGRE
jgi:tRNA threonylcarbamoyladenosine biosynthesis protein TsaB